MASKRTEIREAIKERLADSLAYAVFAGRSLDATELTEFANVYIQEGEATYLGIKQSHESFLVISYRNSGDLTDDELDVLGDEIQAAIADESFGDVMSGIIYTGFAYLDERERDFDGIDLRYTIYY
jgi:hypothetical protein